MNDRPRALFLVGPTACGKHSVAMALAGAVGGEILSLDSMKIYRGMDIGTAKPTTDSRSRIRHHLLDLVDPPDGFSVATYLDHALAAVDDVLARDRVPILAGGTGLYLRTLTRGLFEGPPTDPVVRAAILAGDPPTADLHARLATVDPERAAALHPNDRRRIVRALEVFESSGRPMSAFLAEGGHRALDHPYLLTVLERTSEDTDRRIERRTRLLFEAGFVAEVDRLDRNPATRPGRQAGAATGYPEIRQHLAGAIDLDACIAAVAQSTRRLARKQRTWFRSFEERAAIGIEATDEPASIAERIARLWNSLSVEPRRSGDATTAGNADDQ